MNDDDLLFEVLREQMLQAALDYAAGDIDIHALSAYALEYGLEAIGREYDDVESDY